MSFAQFCTSLIITHIGLLALCISSHRDPKYPTFWEFVQSILTTNRLDLNSHWKPWSLSCGFCSINYSVIIKFEDFDRERTQFLKETGLSDIWSDGLHRNPSKSGKPSEHYFKQLTKDDFSGLRNVFKYDILLGDYEDEIEKLQNRLFR